MPARRVVPARSPLKITKLETFIHRNSWVFVKISTDAGIVGWGEMLKDKSKACAAEAQEMASYLVGKDPRPITHHWQAIYRHGFYRGGPVLTAVLSGIDMALWDIKGKALGLPVHELLGGPTRQKIRTYGSMQDVVNGRCTCVQGDSAGRRPRRLQVRRRRRLRAADGEGVWRPPRAVWPRRRYRHGVSRGVAAATSMLIMKALEQYQPFFYEEPVQCQNVDAMAELAAKTHIPVATGERIFTKWGFREILEKKAASILQPDVCYAGGITELRLIAGHGRVVLHAAGAAQPAGAVLAGRELPDRRGDSQLSGPGARHAVVRQHAQESVHRSRRASCRSRPLPGLGIEFDEAKFMSLVGEPEPYRRTYDRDDGSVVDW